MDKKLARQKRIESLMNIPVEKLIVNLSAPEAGLKYSSQQALIRAANSDPQIVYPFWDEIVEMLGAQNNFIKWGAIQMISDLVRVDKKKKFDKLFKKYFSLIIDKSMITAGNLIYASAKIVKIRPELTDKILVELFKYQKGKYTPECMNVLAGHMIIFFEEAGIKPNKQIIDFVKKNLNNSRHATAMKAKKYLRKLNKGEA